MANHYEILGLNPGAGIAEIKAAFRRLAKLYHPDKNPGGKEHFTKLLKAYEILSDPVLKSTYDYRLSNNLQTQHSVKKNTTTKTWSFEEKEMKRRQYYNDHIKKYTKNNAHYAAEPEKKPYNEYKYILFATPLAVALFLLIMSLATDAPQSYASHATVLKKEEPRLKILHNGDAPYTQFFGGARFDSTDNRKLLVKNDTGNDVIVCLFSATGFWRSCFIQKNNSMELDRLSKKSLTIFYSSGLQFSSPNKPAEPNAEGAFTIDLHFYKSDQAIKLTANQQLTLQSGLNPDFKEISEAEFFRNPVIHS